MKRRRKLIVVAVFTCLWFAVVLMRLRFSGGATQTRLDTSWWLGLVAMFKQGLRTKTFSIPFCTWPLKLEASEANATVSLVVQAVVVSLHPLMLGDSLNPFPGVVPSGVEAIVVVGVQVAGVLSSTPVQVSRK